MKITKKIITVTIKGPCGYTDRAKICDELMEAEKELFIESSFESLERDENNLANETFNFTFKNTLGLMSDKVYMFKLKRKLKKYGYEVFR